MSKKNQKSRPASSSPRKGSQTLQTNDKTRRMKPAARNLLMLALVFLAGGELLYRVELINYTTNGIAYIVAAICTLGAVIMQFSGLDRKFGQRKL